MMLFNNYRVPVECTTEVLRLAKLNASKHDRHIAFREDTHTYYVKGVDDYTSCTTFYTQFFESFDPYKTAQRMVQHPLFPDKKDSYRKYKPMCTLEDGSRRTDEDIIAQILKSWEEKGRDASTKGTNLHRAIELFYNDEPIDADIAMTPEYGYFKDFHRDIIIPSKWRPFRTEMMVFDPIAKICGSVDMLYIDPESLSDLEDWRTGESRRPLKLHMYDWKRSHRIPKFAYGGKKGKGACSTVSDCKFMKYSLQLNIYSYILEKYYNVQILSMTLGVFHPVNSSYVVHKVPRVRKVVLAMFATCGSRKRKRENLD